MNDKLFFLSTGTYDELKAKLSNLGEVMIIPDTKKCYSEICHHIDIHMLLVKENLFIDKETFLRISDDLKKIKEFRFNPDEATYFINNYQLIPIDSILSNRYPFSVCFNAKSYDDTFIHNLTMTDPTILKVVNELEMKSIHVNQGYTGCSLLMLNESNGITSDKGIAIALRNSGINIVLIDEGFIELRGFEYGFIGGCSFLAGNTVIFNGDITKHPNGIAIEQFIFENGYDIIGVEDKPLKDVGSGIVLDLMDKKRGI